jgi:hypothetical protein
VVIENHATADADSWVVVVKAAAQCINGEATEHHQVISGALGAMRHSEFVDELVERGIRPRVHDNSHTRSVRRPLF